MSERMAGEIWPTCELTYGHGEQCAKYAGHFGPCGTNERPAEVDPHGTPAHAPGAKLDAGKVRLGLVLHGFARAIAAVGEVGTYGASKYSPGGWQYVSDGVERYTDAMYRHLLAEAAGEQRDAATGLHHAAHAAWNALARLELALRLAEADR